MAIRNIVKKGDPILNKKCKEVVKFNDHLFQLIDDMIETLDFAKGAGLAAPQVGVLRRVAVVKISEDDDLVELINPEIVETSGKQEEVEGCLSCPGEAGITARPMRVKVKTFDRSGKEKFFEAEGMKARAFCHEIDHLDGILFEKRAIRMLGPDELEE